VNYGSVVTLSSERPLERTRDSRTDKTYLSGLYRGNNSLRPVDVRIGIAFPGYTSEKVGRGNIGRGISDAGIPAAEILAARTSVAEIPARKIGCGDIGRGNDGIEDWARNRARAPVTGIRAPEPKLGRGERFRARE
jgi:hypothetical protein